MKQRELLKELKKLFTKINLIILKIRVSRFHEPTNKHTHLKFSQTLYDFINEVVVDVTHIDNQNSYKICQNTHFENLSYPSDTDHSDPKIKNIQDRERDSLSEYFQINKALEQHPTLEAMLRRRIWSHVHTAHLLARNNDKKTANLHIEIASSAIKVLSHYMEKDEFDEFVAMILKQLKHF